jgi:hypothetical protein
MSYNPERTVHQYFSMNLPRFPGLVSQWWFPVSQGKLIGAEVEVVKRNELHRFVVLPQRRVVIE